MGRPPIGTRAMAAAKRQQRQAATRIKPGEWTRSVVTVNGGRGFVVEVERQRLVITAAHCLHELILNT